MLAKFFSWLLYIGMRSRTNLQHDSDYYEHISPTAFVIAFERIFTDIPLSREIFSILKEKGLISSSDERLTGLAPRYEARYKLVSDLVEETNNSNILEIAPGMSPRGLICAAGSPGINYIELDLPGSSGLKQEIIQEVSTRLNYSTLNLWQIAGNAMNSTDVQGAIELLDNPRPLTVVCEGLMRYLDFDEKKLLATNILAILRSRGGGWITPDITLKSLHVGRMQALEATVADISGIDLTNNYFDSIEQAKSFFENIGFSVSIRGFIEVIGSLSSPQILGLDNLTVENILRSSVAFVMQAR